MANVYGYLQDESSNIFIPGIPYGGKLYIGGVPSIYRDSNEALFIGGNGNHIYFRPYGVYDEGNQVAIQTDGHIIMKGMSLDRRYGRAETYQSTSETDDTMQSATESGGYMHRSGMFSVCGSSYVWYHLLNMRHRNGDGDGSSYGMQIRQSFSITSSMEVRCQSAGTWSNWHQLYKARTLYNNTSGTNGTVTLSEAATGFKFIEVFCHRENAYEMSVKFEIRTDGQVGKVQETGGSYIYFSTLICSGSNIVTNNYSRSVRITDATQTIYDTNIFYITKVVGYR